MLNIALPKGRLGEQVYEMFDKAGFSCPQEQLENWGEFNGKEFLDALFLS